MAVCPNGHDSASDDFCDLCGMRIGGNRANPATAPAAAVGAVGPPTSGGSGPPRRRA